MIAEIIYTFQVDGLRGVTNAVIMYQNDRLGLYKFSIFQFEKRYRHYFQNQNNKKVWNKYEYAIRKMFNSRLKYIKCL